ncbi:hypothetical protein Rsub_09802 [Raphidocelis subcapitata]|uniref:Uncharacterized protein n=1 Tax=Raphidocelis subcapitata TaxID=307507 RepID=A0A2V0PIY1_9CHLO|nr:hypothetical protein Rsub_09802 [Raphidocelis subcapitata]|eukprot:GBF97005.1 hypothetical protein Rsub_09802 [Raphidocelis subcapitata]
MNGCVTFQKLAGLQAPLASLNAAARVTYRISRVRLAGNYLAFSSDPLRHIEYRDLLQGEIHSLRNEYKALMYGGRITPVANVSYDTNTPAAAFASEAFAYLFFRTKACLREDPTSCYPPGHEYYEITHTGLDALAVNLFEDYTIGQFQAVTQLHQIMLVVTIFLVVGFMGLLYRPYVRLLHEESRDIAGMLSALPAETAVEDVIKTQVLGLQLRTDGRSASMTAGTASMAAPGFPPGGMPPGGRLMLMPPGGAVPPGGYSGYGGGYGGPGGGYGGPGDGQVTVNIGARGPQWGGPPGGGGYY